MKNEDLDKLFAAKFQHSEVEVPNHLWQGIEQQLDAAPVKVKKIKSNWKWYAVAASILFLIGFAFQEELFKNNEQTVQEQTNSISSTEPKAIESFSKKSDSEDYKIGSIPNKTMILEDKIKQNEIKNPVSIAIKHKERPIRETDLFIAEKTENLLIADSKPILEKMEVMHSVTASDYSQQLPALSLGLMEHKILDKTKSSFLVTLLNTVSDKINIIEKDFYFSNDEEGTLLITLSK